MLKYKDFIKITGYEGILTGYKFYMAGYHAASWVKLNKLLDNPLHNPFREYVEIARSRLIEVPDE